MADEGFGLTIEFADTGFQAEIIDISLEGRERKSIDSTHMATTPAWKTFFPSDLKSGGTLTMQLLYDPDDEVPIDQPAEEVTVTFPIPVGGSAGATEVFQGFFVSAGRSIPLEDRMTCTAVLQISGEPVLTLSS